jgi:SAM-dependent methyltransferase
MTEPFTKIANHYDTLVSEYGHDPRACDYGSSSSQTVKFQVLAEATLPAQPTILDVGCGFADYSDYLVQRLGQGAFTYTGVDLSACMVAKAKDLHPGLELCHSNFLDQDFQDAFDVVNTNGTFYLLGEDAPKIMQALIRKMFAAARCVVTFNSLSTWASKYEPGEFYADPLETLVFCRTLSPRVVLRHDYLPHDFTIYLYK